MRLFVNGRLLSNKCTSVHLSELFLSFTNSTDAMSHELFNFELSKKLPWSSASINNPEVAADLPSFTEQSEANFNVRAIERGARIVLVDQDPGIRTVL